MTSDLSPSAPINRSPTKRDYSRYKALLGQIHEDIETIETALRRLARNLKTVRDGQLYVCGGYASFAEFCQKELGNSRQQAYRLIAAHDVMQGLLEAGVAEQDLPQTERLCREIHKLQPDEQARVWKAVIRQVRQRGHPATIVDVKTVAAEELKTPSAIDRQQTELIQKFESVSRALKVGLRFDTLTPVFRIRLIATLTDIAQTVTTMIAALRSPAIDKRTQAPDNDDEGRDDDD